MGWASGSRLMGAVIDTLCRNVSDKRVRQNIYIDLVDAFENMDCDTLDECCGEDMAYDEVIEECYPPEVDESTE